MSAHFYEHRPVHCIVIWKSSIFNTENKFQVDLQAGRSYIYLIYAYRWGIVFCKR